MSLPDLRAAWGRVRESLWFLPSLIVLGSIVLAVGMVELSTVVDQDVLRRWPRVFGAGADGSRSMLSAIAGSMITVAGVTFSITMVAVTQASTQYTPRILRNFMRDRANQTVLGIFVGIFAYCLVVLRTIRAGGEEAPFVPSLAVLVGVLLAIVGIAVLIFFVHHIATTLQASEIVSRITRDTDEAVDRLYPEKLGPDAGDTEPPRLLASIPSGQWRPVPARGTGYIQRADVQRLVRVAAERSLLVRLERTAGEFVVEGQPTATFAHHPASPAGARPDRGDGNADDVVLELADRFTLSTYRTVDQDAGFGIRQLVDIALKALSPGINDTTTAITCLDYLGAILMRLAQRRMEVAHRGEDGVLRVIAERPTFEDLLGLAMDEIRRNAGGNVTVLGRHSSCWAALPRRRWGRAAGGGQSSGGSGWWTTWWPRRSPRPTISMALPPWRGGRGRRRSSRCRGPGKAPSPYLDIRHPILPKLLSARTPRHR